MARIKIGNFKGPQGEKGLEPLQVKSIFNSSYTTIDQTTPWPKSDFNRTPIVGDVFMNMDGASNMGKWIVIESDNDKTTVMIKLLSCVSCKGKNGIPGDKGEKGEPGEPGKNATITANATQSSAGLESAEDKKNLDRLTEMLDTKFMTETEFNELWDSIKS